MEPPGAGQSEGRFGVESDCLGLRCWEKYFPLQRPVKEGRSGPVCLPRAGETLAGMPRKKGQWLEVVPKKSDVLWSIDSRLRFCLGPVTSPL